MSSAVWGHGLHPNASMGRYTVGLVVPSLTEGGGVPAATRFLCETIEKSDLFNYRVFSIPSSSRDSASVRLIAPHTWFRGPVVQHETWQGRQYHHVGCVLAEFEFQRYRPRALLTRHLRECDLIHVVAGSPAWGLAVGNVDRPVAIHVATLARVERQERFRKERGLLTAWRRLMTILTARLDRRAVRAVDRVFVMNSWMERTVGSWTDSEAVVLAPPGVDVEFFHPPPRCRKAELGHILSVGRFDDRRKNVSLLFEAYAELRKSQRAQPRLVLVGESGPRHEDWSRAQQLGISDHVQFLHGVPRRKLAELYREASLFVLSSSEEGLGLVILEAMASGLPVVSTATEGAREAVVDGETGLLTPVGDAKALGEAMSRLLGAPSLRYEMGRLARIRAVRRYSIETAGQRFLTIYKELLGIHNQ